MSAKISIIIPAYNAAKTVEKTVRNVLASTIAVHVYVVDDGSTDETAAILDNLSNVSNLTVLHQQNCGAYQARLNALKLITTPYFGFVDADDTVEPDMFEKMVNVIEKNDLDCVQVKVKGEGEDSGALKIISGDDLESHKFKYLVNPKEACYIWDKVYRNQYDFEKFEPTDRITNFDDMVFNFQFFAKIKRMGFLDAGLYHYATTEGSAVHAFGPRQRHDFIWMVKNHYRLCKLLFSSALQLQLPTPTKIKLFLGHLDWLLTNTRSAAITWVRSVLRLSSSSSYRYLPWFLRNSRFDIESKYGRLIRQDGCG